MAAEIAPWRNTFLHHLKSLEPPICVLSTLHYESASTQGPVSHATVTPRCRTVVFRGMWASLPTHPQNPAPLNPEAYESNLLSFSNDARMEKTTEILASGVTSASHSAGGAPVEVVFWVSQTRTQWRIRGRALVLGPDIDGKHNEEVRESISNHMRATGPSTENWTFSREITAHFGNLSPGMRGSFKNPPPGTPISKQPLVGQRIGQTVMDLYDKEARENFRVVVVIPEEVDRLDLSNPEQGKRWNYRLVDDSWRKSEVWP